MSPIIMALHSFTCYCGDNHGIATIMTLCIHNEGIVFITMELYPSSQNCVIVVLHPKSWCLIEQWVIPLIEPNPGKPHYQSLQM